MGFKKGQKITGEQRRVLLERLARARAARKNGTGKGKDKGKGKSNPKSKPSWKATSTKTLIAKRDIWLIADSGNNTASKTIKPGEKLKVSYWANTGKARAFDSHWSGTMLSAYVGPDDVKNWPKEWAKENPSFVGDTVTSFFPLADMDRMQKGITGDLKRAGSLITGKGKGKGKRNPWDKYKILSRSPYLVTDGSLVYAGHVASNGDLLGIPLKQQGAWGDSSVGYSDMLDWHRAYESTVHGTRVVHVPGPGGTKQFVYYGKDTYKELEKGKQKATKAKSSKTPKRGDFYYKRMTTPFGMKYYADKKEANLKDYQTAYNEAELSGGTKEYIFELIDRYTKQNPSKAGGNGKGKRNGWSTDRSDQEVVQAIWARFKKVYPRASEAEANRYAKKIAALDGQELRPRHFAEALQYGSAANGSISRGLAKTAKEKEADYRGGGLAPIAKRALAILGRPGGVKGKRNPSPSSLSSAQEAYESFHGTPATKTVSVEESEYIPTTYAELGLLHYLKFRTPTGITAELTFDTDAKSRVMLTQDPATDGLYLVGGDQSVSLKPLGMHTQDWQKPLMVLGRLDKLTYRTKKHFDKFQDIHYWHRVGEETGDKPTLLYSPISKRLYIAGGAYQIKPEGIVN